MPDPAVATSLKDMGLAGIVISAMGTTIVGMAGFIVLQWKAQAKLAAKTMADRLAERDILLGAINNTAKVVEAVVRTSEAGKLVTEELVEAVAGWTTAMEVIKERMLNQHDANTEKLKDIKTVVGSFAEAHRTLTAMVTEVRNYQLTQRRRRP